MAHWTLCLSSGLLLFCASQVLGQVVQLPTFRYFSVGTTVVIPDRGATYLGGVSRAGYGSASYGVPILGHLPGAGRLFRNRSFGASLSSSDAHATATIVDLKEMDEAVLREAASRRGVGTTNTPVEEKAAFISRHVARRGFGPTGAKEVASPAAARIPASGGDSAILDSTTGRAATGQPAARSHWGSGKLLVLAPGTR